MPKVPAQKSAPHELVPRHVAALCDLARRSGLEVVPPHVEPYKIWATDDPEDRLVAEWIGSSSAFAATGLLVPSQLRVLTFPTNDHFLCVPAMSYQCALGEEFSPVAFGYISGNPEALRWILDFGAPPLSINQRNGVEVILTRKELARHGTAESLVADGVAAKHLPIGRRTAKRVSTSSTCEFIDDRVPLWHPTRWWGCRRQPDGTFVYREESNAALAERVRYEDEQNAERRAAYGLPPEAKKPSHLRLVVDNT